MKRIILALLVLAIVACREKQYTIYNGCYGTWAEVYRGNNDKLVSRVDFGHVAPVEVRAWAGTSLNFIAVVHELGTGRVVGHAQSWVTIPRSSTSWGAVGPDDIYIWAITHLYDSNWDCRPR
ncbi:MAG: hypothetical protein AAB695_02105 [Patescibacteria group bacterium]